ncbi:MAG: hypothetical protein MR911_12460 [Spirochaetia bacterium]|nr:hypothetical protein [Spirochaetia bacterium]MCI6367291.1 hypothetical protein [Spirochaetia bacterium]
MKKYANVLVALCALFAFGLVSCKSYSDDDNNAALVAVLNQQSATPADYAKILSTTTGIQLDKNYVTSGDWTESFKVTSDGTVEYNSDFKATIAGTAVPTGYPGIIIFTRNQNHVNYGHYCYPDYDEDKWDGSKLASSEWGTVITHHGCYTAIYITNGETDKTFRMAQAVWRPENQPEGRTACAKTLENVKELFAKEGYQATCEGDSSAFNRSLSSEKIPGFICGTFTLSDAE